jgi:hypothetical protein
MTSPNPRFSVHPHQGQPLPSNWQQAAKERAKAADAHYLENLQNAWRSRDSADPNMMRQARLQPPSWDELLGKK